MTPLALASGPSTTCSLIITASNPAPSATWAHRTSSGRSRPVARVQFSLRIITIRGEAPMPLPDQVGDCGRVLTAATGDTDDRTDDEYHEREEHQHVAQEAQSPRLCGRVDTL